MSPTRIFLTSLLAMVAFAGNSILCRMALAGLSIDPATFTLIRLGSGAFMLSLLVFARRRTARPGGNWLSAAALFAYAAGFSFAYVSLATGTGALLLFAAVQITMMGWALFRGERLAARQATGLVLAVAGFMVLLAPGIEAPSPKGAVLMVIAGSAWGLYSLRGAGARDAVGDTAGNFLRAGALAMGVSLVLWSRASAEPLGIACAVVSGALASGIGYALWYAVLPHIKASTAATVQLSVPALAALGGVLLLGERLTARLVLAAAATFAGVILFSAGNRKGRGALNAPAEQ